MKVKHLKKWLEDLQQSDQEITRKSKFVHNPREGESSLEVVGKSNGLLKTKVTEFIKTNKNIDLTDLFLHLTNAWEKWNIQEAHILIAYIMEKYKKQFTKDIWGKIDTTWIPVIDFWTSADHLCMNVLTYFPLEEKEYWNDLTKWVKSDNFWRRRIAIVSPIKKVRKTENLVGDLLQLLDLVITDKSYYVQKGVSWMLREASKSSPEEIYHFIQRNIDHFNKTNLRNTMKSLSKNQQEKLLELYDKV